MTSLKRRLQAFVYDSDPIAIFGGAYDQPEPTSEGRPNYDEMNIYKKQYLSVTLVQSCIKLIAYFSTKNGFIVQLEPVDENIKENEKEKLLEEHGWLLDLVNQTNRKVNLDNTCKNAVLKKLIYGSAPFEQVWNKEMTKILRVIPLIAYDFSVKIDENYHVEYFRYSGGSGVNQVDFDPKLEEDTKDKKAGMDRILYFLNDPLEADMVAYSAIEPIYDLLTTRDNLLKAIRECSGLMWAPIFVHELDTAGMPDAKAKALKEAYKKELKPAKHIIINERIKVTKIDTKLDLNHLLEVKHDVDREIIGNFFCPKYMLGREDTINRATAEVEQQAFYEGPILQQQRDLKRSLEAQYYEPMVRRAIKEKDGEEAEIKVRVRHVWNPLTTADLGVIGKIVAQLYEAGIIDQEKAWELLDWDIEDLQKKKQEIGQPEIKPTEEPEEEEE